MATNLGYYLETDSGRTPRLRKYKNGNVAELDFSDEGDIIAADSITDVSYKKLTPNDGGATGNGETNPLLNLDVLDPSSTTSPNSKTSSGIPSSDQAGASVSGNESMYARAGLGILQGYMKADAIRAKANYEADVLQLNADLNLFEAGEQQGVDFTKIIRYGEQVDETVESIGSEFTRLEQEGGAAQDLIAENTLQGRLNQMAMMNEAQARVASAEFARKSSYLKAQQMRDISRKQGRQAIQAGYVQTGLAFAGLG